MTKTDALKTKLDYIKILLTPIIGTYFLIVYYVMLNNINYKVIIVAAFLAFVGFWLGKRYMHITNELEKVPANQ